MPVEHLRRNKVSLTLGSVLGAALVVVLDNLQVIDGVLCTTGGL